MPPNDADPREFDLGSFLGRNGVPSRVIEYWDKTAEAQSPQDDAGDGEILVVGPIVSDTLAEVYTIFGLETYTSPASFRARLADIDGDITVRINSPGGDVWAAADIVGMLDERASAGDAVTCRIAGLAASAAAIVALCGETVSMNALGMLMVHQASTGLWGKAPELRKAADLLDKIDGQQAGFIARRTEMSRDDAMSAIANETWYEPTEALELGLIDSINDGPMPEGNDPADAEASAGLTRQTLAARNAVFAITGVQ